MRIGLLIYGSLDTVSGGYLYDRKLVEHLQAQGDTVAIISLPWRSYRQHLTDNWSGELLQRLRDLPVDVLLQDELNHPSLAWLNGRLRGHVDYPLVSIVHHLRCSEGHRRPLNDFYRWVERRYLRRVDGFIYNSATTRETVKSLLGTRHDAAGTPSLVARPAADHLQPPTTVQVKEQVRKRCQEKGPLRILFVGNVIVRKGLHTLLMALAHLPPDTYRLDVVGNLTIEPATTWLAQSLIQRQGMSQSVHLHGVVDDAELRQHLMDSHLLVVPSYEGFGIVYLEAMSFGLPVIATTAGAAHEIVTPDANGFLITPDDSAGLTEQINLLQNDRTRLRKMSLAARQNYAASPTWEESMTRVHRWLHENW